MQDFKRDSYFNLTTIVGFRYKVTFRRVVSWFFSWKYLVFFGVSNIALIFFAPHNSSYGLIGLDRFVFWPIITIEYSILYIALIWLGSLYALSKEERRYYTPVTLLTSSIIGTYTGAFLVAYLTGTEPDLSIYKAMEIFFNKMFICLFEALFFYFVTDENGQLKKGHQHLWEKF